MTSPPSPPNRRRRRIVVTIAVLVLGLGWWFWPRVDQRFVGTWSTKRRGGSYTLFPDGTGTVSFPGGGFLPFRWWGGHGQLTLHYSSESVLQTIREELHEIACRIRGTESRGQIARRRVVELLADQIRFDDQIWLRIGDQPAAGEH
jgi:hypothetical protein